MLKIALLVLFSGPAYRQSANHYAIPGEGVVETKNCTVSANGELTVKVTRDWVYFYDRDGRREADCQRLTEKRPTVVVRPLTIPRNIATVK